MSTLDQKQEAQADLVPYIRQSCTMQAPEQLAMPPMPFGHSMLEIVVYRPVEIEFLSCRLVFLGIVTQKALYIDADSHRAPEFWPSRIFGIGSPPKIYGVSSRKQHASQPPIASGVLATLRAVVQVPLLSRSTLLAPRRKLGMPGAGIGNSGVVVICAVVVVGGQSLHHVLKHCVGLVSDVCDVCDVCNVCDRYILCE